MAVPDAEPHPDSPPSRPTGPPPISLPPLPGLSDGPWARGRRWWESLSQQQRPAAAAAAVAALVVVVAGAWWITRPPTAAPEVVLPHAGAAAPAPAHAIEVFAHAAGAVARPGVYRLAEGARVADLIDAAGGPADDADVDRLNLAAEVRDGDRIYVPRVGEPVTPGEGAASAGDGVVDLNLATAADLESLPGIGPAIARAILDWREQHGPFTSVEQLLDVRGIGEAKLAALRDQVRV